MGRRNSNKLTAVDLFSGCGGLTLGLRQAGFRVLGAIEIDELAVETYKANHRRVAVWPDDIQDLKPRAIMKKLGLKRGELDLLAGCPPCQGFSTMTTLNGKWSTDDDRNDLVYEFVRFAKAMLPRAVMMENVPGLAKDPRLRWVKAQLRKLGYAVEHRVLDAQEYGVPQRRRRMILLASRICRPTFASPARARRTVRDALLKVTDKKEPLHSLRAKHSSRVVRLIKSIPKNGGSRTDLPLSERLRCHETCSGFRDVYGRMRWDEVAPTITGGCCNPSKGRFLHPSRNRCITLREAALLQSFPSDYFFSLRGGKYRAAQMIGNALPPAFIRAHARQLARDLLPRTNTVTSEGVAQCRTNTI